MYFTDALHPPFPAMWRDPDEPGHGERVTVLSVADVDERRGILLAVRRPGGKERRVLAEQLWAAEAGSRAPSGCPSSSTIIALGPGRQRTPSGMMPSETRLLGRVRPHSLGELVALLPRP